MPWRLWRWLGVRGVVEESVREATTRFARATVARGTIRKAAVVVAQNGDVARQLASRPDAIVEPNLAFTASVSPAPARPAAPSESGASPCSSGS